MRRTSMRCLKAMNASSDVMNASSEARCARSEACRPRMREGAVVTLALALAIASAWIARPANARELTDVTGARVSVVDRPARVVTLMPSLGELAADLSGE